MSENEDIECSLCNKKLTPKDHCSAVNTYTFEENRDYWQGIHNRFGTHFVRTGEPIFSKPEGA